MKITYSRNDGDPICKDCIFKGGNCKHLTTTSKVQECSHYYSQLIELNIKI